MIDAREVGLGKAAALEFGGQAWQIFWTLHAFEGWELWAEVWPPRGHLQNAAKLAHALDEVGADANVVDAGHLDHVLQVIDWRLGHAGVGRDELGTAVSIFRGLGE